MGIFGPSKNMKNLKDAFDIKVNPSRKEKIAAALAGKKDKAVEKIPAKKPKGRAARQIKTKDRAETACTCRKPALNRHGECARCHKKPGGKR